MGIDFTLHAGFSSDIVFFPLYKENNDNWTRDRRSPMKLGNYEKRRKAKQEVVSHFESCNGQNLDNIITCMQVLQ